MARERYVSTPAEVDEGFDSGIRRERRGPFKKLREAIAPKRVAKHAVRVEDGGGESRMVSPAPRIEPMRSVTVAEAQAEAIQPVAAQKAPARRPTQPTRPAPATPARGSAAPRRARRVRVADDVLPASP